MMKGLNLGLKTRNILMLLGFAAAFIGDWFLVVRRCGAREPLSADRAFWYIMPDGNNVWLA